MHTQTNSCTCTHLRTDRLRYWARKEIWTRRSYRCWLASRTGSTTPSSSTTETELSSRSTTGAYVVHSVCTRVSVWCVCCWAVIIIFTCVVDLASSTKVLWHGTGIDYDEEVEIVQDELWEIRSKTNARHQLCVALWVNSFILCNLSGV